MHFCKFTKTNHDDRTKFYLQKNKTKYSRSYKKGESVWGHIHYKHKTYFDSSDRWYKMAHLFKYSASLLAPAYNYLPLPYPAPSDKPICHAFQMAPSWRHTRKYYERGKSEFVGGEGEASGRSAKRRRGKRNVRHNILPKNVNRLGRWNKFCLGGRWLLPLGHWGGWKGWGGSVICVLWAWVPRTDPVPSSLYCPTGKALFTKGNSRGPYCAVVASPILKDAIIQLGLSTAVFSLFALVLFTGMYSIIVSLG